MSEPDGPDEVLQTVLPPALELMTAWSLAERDNPALFRQALARILADIGDSADPPQAAAEVLFGLSSLSGILLDELATCTGFDREQVLGQVHARYLNTNAA